MNWYLTVGVESKNSTTITQEKGIGIDLGIKDLAICSDGNKYQSINKTQKVKKLEKQKRRLQRSVSRSYEKIRKERITAKQINSLGSKTINDFLDLTPAKQYHFIHEHLKRINIDIDTCIVIFEYNSH